VQLDKISIEEKVRKVIDIILAGEYKNSIIDGNSYTIQEYQTKEEDECVLESHRNHIDVQYMLDGEEEFITYMTSGLTYTGKYDEINDVEYWSNGIISAHTILVPGSLIVVNNGQPHKGAIKIRKSCSVRKLICKIGIYS
jgi:uncharacterized protein, YhcH/YjgK/YiaL family